MAITIRTTTTGISAVANGSATNLTPGAQNYLNDIALLFIAQEHDSDTIMVPGGWTRIATWVYGSAVRFWLYGRRNPSSAASPVISRESTTGRFWAIVREFVGCTKMGEAWETVGTPVMSGPYTDPATIPGVTTVTANTMIVNFVGAATGNINSITSVTGTSPTTYNAGYYEIAVGGSEVSIIRSYAMKPALGATGNVIVDFANSPDNVIGGITLALTEDPRVPSHTFDVQSQFGGASSDPTTGILSVTSDVTLVTLGLLTRAAGRTGGAPTCNASTMLLASSIVNGTLFAEVWYLTGAFNSTLDLSIPNTGSSVVWCVASSYKAPAGRLSVLDIADSVASTGKDPAIAITTSNYSGDAIVAIMGTEMDSWESAGQSGIELYDNDAGNYGVSAQYLLQEIGGLTDVDWTGPLVHLLQEGFEAEYNQNLSGYNGWTGTSAYYIHIVSVRSHSGNRSLELNQGLHANYKAFSSSQTGSKFTVDFYFNIIESHDNNVGILWVTNGIYSSTSNVNVGLATTTDWTESYHYLLRLTSSGFAQVMTITTNTWIHAEIQVNLDANPDTYQLWIDGVLKGTWDCPNNLNTATGISFFTANIGGNRIFGVDDLDVYAGARGGETTDQYALAVGAFNIANRTSQIVDEVIGIIKNIKYRILKRRFIDETVNAEDTIFMIKVIKNILNETLEIASEVFYRFQIIAQGILETLNLSEELVPTRFLRRIMNEVENLFDVNVRSRILIKIRAEMLHILDSLKRYFVPVPTGGFGIVLADTGALEILKSYFNNDVPAQGKNLRVKLYTNKYTPTDTSTVNDFTEAAGGGYAEKTLTTGSWYISPTQDPPDSIYTKQVFEFTGPLTGNATIYGYYVVNAEGTLVYAEKATYAFQPVTEGSLYEIIPRFRVSFGIPS